MSTSNKGEGDALGISGWDRVGRGGKVVEPAGAREGRVRIRRERTSAHATIKGEVGPFDAIDVSKTANGATRLRFEVVTYPKKGPALHHACVAFGSFAESLMRFLEPGMPVDVSGRLEGGETVVYEVRARGILESDLERDDRP